jgi:hypothetical protein
VDLLQSLVDSYRQAVALAAAADGDSGPRTISSSLLPSENHEARPVAVTVSCSLVVLLFAFCLCCSRSWRRLWDGGLASGIYGQ